MPRKPTIRECELIMILNKEGKCPNAIAGFLQSYLKSDATDTDVLQWHVDLSLKPNEYRKPVKVATKRIVPVEKSPKILPASAKQDYNPINVAIKELKACGKDIPTNPIEVMRAANRIRKANGIKQLDRVADWLV